MKLVHVAGHDRKPPVRKSLLGNFVHRELAVDKAVNEWASVFDAPELQAIEREDPELARRVGETY